MSHPDSKDTRPRTLGALRGGSGRIEVVEGSPELPLRLVLTQQGRKSSWTHQAGRGPTALYVLEREW